MGKRIKDYTGWFFKGMGMGAANVIPGVSGGTIALITGIFEKLIHSIKSFDVKAFKLLFSLKFKSFSQHVNLEFLIMVFIGIVASIVSLAKILEYLFLNYPVYIWAYFFGLILASVYFVGQTIEKWNTSVILTFLIGTAIAISISFLSSASRNENFIYLMLCGVAAICSMILPGLSGSFILILMGNYELVVIEAVNDVRPEILLPVILGAVVGLVAFSHFLSWIYQKFKNETIATLTGFIMGSLVILWPWKEPVYKANADGTFILKSDGEYIITGWERFIPKTLSTEVIWAIGFILTGVFSIWIIERLAQVKAQENN